MSYTSHLTQYTSHLTPHSAYLSISWGTDFHRFHTIGQNLCDRCDINCDRRDINDKVNKMNLIFKLFLYLVGLLVYMIKISFFFTIYYEENYFNIVIPGNLTTGKLVLPDM